jgi:hypothetical protein
MKLIIKVRNIKRERSLARRKIPAATIIVACIRAEIGVGHSIASANHTQIENYAYFATTPRNNKKAHKIVKISSIVHNSFPKPHS